MATVVVGALVGAAWGAGSAGLAAALGGTLAAGLAGAAIGGGLGALGEGALDTPAQIAQVGQPQDKTTPQQQEKLDALSIGDESEKRKRKGAKSKFKIKKDAIGEQTGVAFSGTTPAETKAVTGVQL